MKTIVLFIIILLGKTISKAEEVNGILVKNNGDTIHQILKIDEKDFSNYLVSNNLVSKLKDINGKKIPLKKYKYLFFKVNKEDFHFYSINISENDWDESSTEKAQFYRLLNNTNGKIKLYEFYDISDMAALGMAAANAIHKKFFKSFLIEKNDNYIILSQIGFKNNIKTILSDNLELIQKIKDGVYTFSDIPLIVAEYNNWYSVK